MARRDLYRSLSLPRALSTSRGGQIEILPSHAQRLTLATARKHQHADDVGDTHIWMCRQRYHKALQLFGLEIAFSFVFSIFLNALAGVIRSAIAT